ncbi:MAG: hypothetical protein GY750_01335 [Lentisphaerae bacterium]|nr:hypothetical protein [Lentisphaerota bacterium]MCP4100062.1 hypothetical protein [Lentisphaerota bacterium]
MSIKSFIVFLFAVFIFPLLSYGDNKTKFGAIFCDYGSAAGMYSPKLYGQAVVYANKNFPIIRTTTDFGTGYAYNPKDSDAVFQVGGNADLWGNGQQWLKQYSEFQKAVCDTNKSEYPIKVILEIENPQKWFYDHQSTMNYIYQFVLPMMNGMDDEYWENMFKSETLRPRYIENIWKTHKVCNTKEDAGYTTYKPGDDKYNHVIGIIIGHEVGNVMTPWSTDNKIDDVNQLDHYVQMLNDALAEVGIKDRIYVTTTISVGFANNDNQRNFLYTNDGSKYVFQSGTTTVKGKNVDFSRVLNALSEIKNQNYNGNYNMGVLVSMYPYWNPYCGDLPNAEAVCQTYETMYNGIKNALPDDLKELKVSFGEAGAPSYGNRFKDGAPHIPSVDLAKSAVDGAVMFAEKNSSVPLILFWNLFDSDFRNPSCPDENNPEFWYGLYNNTLSSIGKGQVPELRFDIPDFRK